VGLLYNPALPRFLRENLDSVDYVSLIPDMGHEDRGAGQSPRYVEIEAWVELLNWLTTCRPLIAHNVGLSIGTAGRFDREYVEQMKHWHGRGHFVWHSDHLSFAQVRDAHDHEHNAGLAIPVPYDEEVLDLIAERVDWVQNAIDVPFLLENNVYFFNVPEQEMTEPEFLNRLTERTGCGLLLDIHNLYTNARNHGFNPLEFVDDLDLSRVVEVHIAGGNEFGGMYIDSHAGPCPGPVWDLLEYVVPRSPNLCGITFEFHESYYPKLLDAGLRDQLDRARQTWARSR
jgi:uncharacterized protein (UPF0276 family)